MKHKTNSTRMAKAPRTVRHAPMLSPQATRTAVIAGAATLGAGALATVAIMMRRPLGRLAVDAAGGIADFGSSLTLSNLLALANLQRRRSSLWTIGPAVGALIAGATTGSLVSIWLGRRENGGTFGHLTADSPVQRANSTSDPFDAPTNLEAR